MCFWEVLAYIGGGRLVNGVLEDMRLGQQILDVSWVLVDHDLTRTVLWGKEYPWVPFYSDLISISD